MDAIDRKNPSLRDVLPKVFARGNLDPTNMGGCIESFQHVKCYFVFHKRDCCAHEVFLQVLAISSAVNTG